MTASKIAVIGNAGGGKTTLSLHLAKLLSLPLVHVDSFQFDADMQLRPAKDTIDSLNTIQDEQKWIIDGYGPLDILEKRLNLADRIVFIDLPIWRHFWWSTKRLVKDILRGQINFQYAIKLYKTIWRVHKGMRPELIRILSRDAYSRKVIFICNLSDWQRVYRQGL